MRVKTEARREAILEVAAEVFLELGYERASMGEISSRLGGSKGTLYSYFPSKEALFIEVTLQAGRLHVENMFSALQSGVGQLHTRLQRFGEGYLQVVTSAKFVSMRRIVIAESGQSEIGRTFYDSGPRRGHERIANILHSAMEAGELRADDAALATRQLIALLNAETSDECLFVLKSTWSKAEGKRIVQRAVSAFMAAYAVRRAPA